MSPVVGGPESEPGAWLLRLELRPPSRVPCGEQHLQRYLNEFAFRYSHRSRLGVEDAQRALIALRGIEGKRLTYRRLDQAQN